MSSTVKTPKRLRHPWNGTPFPYLAVMYIGPAILLAISGICGGWSYFVNNDSAAFTVSLGMLAFNSVFFAFVFNSGEGTLKIFHEKMNIALEQLKMELGNKLVHGYASHEHVKDFEGFEKSIREYRFLVSPALWFYASTLCFLFSVVIAISELAWKPYVLFGLIFLGLLLSSWLVLSIFSLHITKAFYSSKIL